MITTSHGRTAAQRRRDAMKARKRDAKKAKPKRIGPETAMDTRKMVLP